MGGIGSGRVAEENGRATDQEPRSGPGMTQIPSVSDRSRGLMTGKAGFSPSNKRQEGLFHPN